MEKGKYPKGIYMRGKVFWLRYAGLDGNTVFESSGSDKLKVAEALLHKRKADIQVGKQPEIIKIKNHTFQELALEYIKWAERQRAFKQKRLVVSQLASQFGHYPLRRFDTRMVEQFQTERLQKGNKPGTVNRHISIMKHMFTKAVDWNMVEDETLKRVRRVKLLEENNRRLRYLSKEECQSLINSCDHHLKPIVTMALNTGMRKGEILNLKWDNVDLRHGFILLDHTKNGERREIPINATLRDTLAGMVRRLDVPYVFISNKTGERYGNLQRSFNTACRRAGIKDFHFHDLRHTFASQLVMAGIDLTTIKELLGHKTLTMTLRYAHLAPSHKVNAVDILDKTINKTPTIQKLYKKEGTANE
ncbi:MAG: site-specific integrase [Syntrophales bacterium]|jgi:integrase